MALCFSPVGDKFRERSRKFPALFSSCTINWFLPWPEEALISVAHTFVDNPDFNLETPPETKTALCRHIGAVHKMVDSVCSLYYSAKRRNVYVTPKSFLSFLNAYKKLYKEKYDDLEIQERSVNVGLEKLAQGAKDIEVMQG
mmetsp:Transcript_8258/g.4401  ORF Transcript_8258/g.4401 Transcript_8258/m.4401 type:complete len:142 (+) Transcript_8258:1556-1981(+)